MTTSSATLSQIDADAFIQATSLGSMVEDYEFDAARNYHLYFLDDGSVMAIFLKDGVITSVELDPNEGTDPTPTTPVAEAAAPAVLSDVAQDLLFDDAVAALNATKYAGKFFTADYQIDLLTGDVTFSLKDGGNISVDVNGVVTEGTYEDRAVAAALAHLDEEQAKQIFTSYVSEQTGEVAFYLIDGGMVIVDVNGEILSLEAEDEDETPAPTNGHDDDPISQQYGFPCGSGR